LPPAGWLLLLLVIAAGLQAYTWLPFDADTSYHLAVGRLIRAHGILQSFPWTPFSWLSDHYADKELLFHLLFVPFAGLDWALAAKIVGALVGTLLLWTLYGVLRVERVRWPGVWVLLALLSSGYFVQRFALVRPHVLAVACALAVTWAATRRRWAVLAAVCFIYPLSYTAWHTALVLVVVAETASRLSGRRLDWRPLAVAVASVAAGLLLHPNFPNILRFFWIVNFQILFGTAWRQMAGFSLGTEFQPLGLKGFLMFEVLPYGYALAAAALAWRLRRRDPLPLAFALAALAFGGLTRGSCRFIEYLSPFATVALALSMRDGWRPRLVASMLSTVSVAHLYFFGGLNEITVMHGPSTNLPDEMAESLRSRIPPGAQVFTPDWIHAGNMMLALPERRFMVALDPVLFYAKDPELYATWYQLVRQPPPNPARVVRDLFGAEYVLCVMNSSGWDYRFFHTAMFNDPAASVEVVNSDFVLFRVSAQSRSAPDGRPGG
jgi:hypothetical protein